MPFGVELRRDSSGGRMLWPVLKCPFCGGILPNEDIGYKKVPLVCPTCSAELQLEERQGYIHGTIALILTVILALLLGLRGLWLLSIIPLWFLVYLFFEFVAARLVPTRFEPYGGKPEGNDAGHRFLGN